jgi:glycoside/pentoside/hexuronide:cation symporter, GPH family
MATPKTDSPVSTAMQPRQPIELAYGTLQFANNAFAAFGGLYLPFLYLEQAHLPPAMFGLAMVLATLLQAITAPAIGGRLQASGLGHSRANMMIAGAIPFAIGFALLTVPPMAGGAVVTGIWLIATLVLASISRSVFEVSYTSVLADLSSSGAQRTHLATFRQAFATAGEATAALVPALALSLGLGSLSFGLFGFAMAIWIIFASMWMRSRLRADPRFGVPHQSPSGTTIMLRPTTLQTLRLHLDSAPLRTLMGSYALAMIGVRMTIGLFPFLIIRFTDGAGYTVSCMIAFLAGSLAGLPVWSRIAIRLGRVAALRLSLCLSGCAILGVLAVAGGRGGALLVPLFAVIGATSVAITSFGVALQADLVDLEQQRLGVRAPAAVAGIYVMVTRASQGFGTSLVGAVLFITQLIPVPDPDMLLLWTYSGGGCAIFVAAALAMASFPAPTVSKYNDPVENETDI